MTEEIKVRVSEPVPRDEVWFVEPSRWEVLRTPNGIRVVEHVRIVGKIVGLPQ